MAYIFDSLGDVSARVLPVLRDVDGLKAVAGRLLVPASHTKVNIQERSRPDGELWPTDQPTDRPTEGSYDFQ